MGSGAIDLFPVQSDLPGFPCAFSEDRRYRYVLWRQWTDTPQPRYLMVIGLNPSTADETTDDPTIRRCIDFARRWGFDALCMTNLFAFRATDPKEMKEEPDPVGDENSFWLQRLGREAGLVLAAWGVHGEHLRRNAEVLDLLHRDGIQLFCLGTTKAGHPRHPLYIRKSQGAVQFPPRKAERPRAESLGELISPVTFSIMPEESDPHEAGPLFVEMDADGARIWWLGTEGEEEPEAAFSWSELRHLEAVARLIEDNEALRDDLVAEVEMYRRMAYRYRNAARSMKARFEEYQASLPEGFTPIGIER